MESKDLSVDWEELSAETTIKIRMAAVLFWRQILKNENMRRKSEFICNNFSP